jgi:outer membrane protein OmpU|tara:strand:- start:469 stop:1413 length:945 start_codon:yes stop_codon:yes gene_type:complete
MNNLKKIGLTALGTAMVSTGAHAAAMSVSGATSIFFNGEDNSVLGNGWSMTDSLSFTASGEMDNGWTVSTTLEVDGNTMDDRSISIDTGETGKLTFSGNGGSGPVGAWDDVTPTANEEAHGVAVSGTATGATGDAADENIFIYDYTGIDGLALKAAYIPSNGATSDESSTEMGALYTGVDGLSVYLAVGENNDDASGTDAGNVDLQNMAVTYAAGAFTVGFQSNEYDSSVANKDRDFSAVGVSYAVNDDMSVSLNTSSVEYEQSGLADQDATGVSISYTQGGMTVSASHSTIDNVAGAEASDNTGYEINFAFAF